MALLRRVSSLKLMTRMRLGCETSPSAAVHRHQLVRHLPICNVQTNLSASAVPKDFNRRLCKLLASTLNKSEDNITVSLSTDLTMTRGASEDATVTVEIWSIGVFDAKRNVYYSKDVINFLTYTLNLPPERIALIFHPLQEEEAGHLTYIKLHKKT